MFKVNENPSYRPIPYKGNGWQEINGSSVLPFLKQVTWVKDSSCEIIRNREIDNSDRIKEEVEKTFVYRGKVGDRTVALLLGGVMSPLRVFMVEDGDVYGELLAMLQRNQGFVDEQLASIGNIVSDNSADALYAWQESFFGVSKNAAMVRKLRGVSMTNAKKKIQGRAELVTEKEAYSIIKAIAIKYDLYNIDLTFGTAGNVLGWCSVSEDSITPLSLPIGLKMWFNKDVLYKHTVVHECAHGIEFMRNGISGHGKGFRKIYKTLLRQYMNLNAEGL